MIGDRVVGTGKLGLNFVNEGPLYMSEDWSALSAHQPFLTINTPEAEYDICDRQSAHKTRVEWVGEREHPQIATEHNATPPPYYPDHPIARQEWAHYLNSVSGMDRRIDWVLEALRREGLNDDTVIVFFADDGRLKARGMHWCWASGIHVSMIVEWPKNFGTSRYKRGTVNHQVITLFDLKTT